MLRNFLSQLSVVLMILLAGARAGAEGIADVTSEEATRALKRNPKDLTRFNFVRIQYDSVGGYGEAYYDYELRRWQRWETDSPAAEENLLFRLSELTTLNPNPKPLVRRLTDADLCDFPLIYMSDPGWQILSEEESAALRNYLHRGGMLWVDDFWGWAEWQNFEEIMEGVLPGEKWRDIPANHAVLKVVFELHECPQVPARDFASNGYGWKWDPPWIHKMPTREPRSGNAESEGVEEVHFRGWFDAQGHLMVVCTHNTDLGDGFEREGEDEWYFKTYSTLAYAMAVNIIVYSLTY